MNESDFYKTVVQQEILDDGAIRRYAKSAVRRKPVFRRVLVPALSVLGALLLVFGVTMAIPSARAEVLLWFAPASAKDYLAADSENRDPVSELDQMITPSEQNDTKVKVNYVADEPYWREIGENFSATLGDTVYDGNSIYIAIDFDGLSGYPLFENAWCPSLPANALLPMFLNEPDNQLLLTLADGEELPAYPEQVSRPVDKRFIQAFHDRFGLHDSFSEETAVAWRDQSWEHCKVNGARVVADVLVQDPAKYRFYPDNGKSLNDYIDENGMLTFHVRYRASVDFDTKLDVDLGTVKVNMTSYKDMKTRSIAAGTDSIVLSGDAVFGEFRYDEKQSCGIRNHSVHLDGVNLHVISPGTVDLFGIHDVQIQIAMPDDWNEELKTAFAKNLLFTVKIDDDLTIGYGGGLRIGDDGSYTMDIDLSDSIPFDRIKTMHTVTLTPSFQWYTGVRIYQTLPNGTEELVKTVPIGPEGSFDEAALENGTAVRYEGDYRSYPESVITLKIN